MAEPGDGETPLAEALAAMLVEVRKLPLAYLPGSAADGNPASPVEPVHAVAWLDEGSADG